MKIVHVVLSFLNLMASIIGGIYFLWLDGRNFYVSENFVGGTILVILVMVVMGYIAQTHLKISKTEDKNIFFIVSSTINMVLFIFWSLFFFSGSQFYPESMLLGAGILLVGGLIIISCFITLISGIKINYEFQVKQGLTPRWPKVMLKIFTIGIIVWAIFYALLIIT